MQDILDRHAIMFALRVARDKYRALAATAEQNSSDAADIFHGEANTFDELLRRVQDPHSKVIITTAAE